MIWTTEKLLDETVRRAPGFREVHARFREQVKRLEAFMLLSAGGIQEQNRHQNERGLRQAQQPDVSKEAWIDIMTYTLAGRVMVTLERKGVMLTVVFDETAQESTAGLQGVRGTEEDIAQLVGDALAQWREHPVLEVDRHVRIAGMW